MKMAERFVLAFIMIVISLNFITELWVQFVIVVISGLFVGFGGEI